MLNVSDKNYYPLPCTFVDSDAPTSRGASRKQNTDMKASQREHIETLLSTMGHEPPKK